MKKALCLILAVLMATVLFASCDYTEKPTIGIIQFGSHESLNNCYRGILKGLEEGAINVDECNVEYVNSNFDPSVSLTQANRLVNSKAKVIIAIATPSAIAAANASADDGIPVVFCAVTDSSVMANYSNITGSSDVPDFDKQIELIKAFMNKKDLKIGVLYSTEESSSPFQIERLEAAAQKAGVSVFAKAVADITTIDTNVNALISEGVDCFVNILDNTIVGKLESNILPITNEKKIPVFGSEIEQVKSGCVASASIEYIDVGRMAGQSAAKILLGESASDIPVAFVTEPQNYYSKKACDLLGITVPQGVTASNVD